MQCQLAFPVTLRAKLKKLTMHLWLQQRFSKNMCNNISMPFDEYLNAWLSLEAREQIYYRFGNVWNNMFVCCLCQSNSSELDFFCVAQKQISWSHYRTKDNTVSFSRYPTDSNTLKNTHFSQSYLASKQSWINFSLPKLN